MPGPQQLYGSSKQVQQLALDNSVGELRCFASDDMCCVDERRFKRCSFAQSGATNLELANNRRVGKHGRSHQNST